MTVNSESPRMEEAAGPKTRVLTAKSATRIGYWNIRTLNAPTKLAQVIKEMDAYNISILGLSEVRWTKSGEFKEGNKTILFSGRQDDIHREGVAMKQIMLRKRIITTRRILGDQDNIHLPLEIP